MFLVLVETPTCAMSVRSWEAHLVERVRMGESVAGELLVATYRPVLLQQAMRVLRNPEDAHDAVQETFVKAFRSLGDFDTNRPLKPWLSRICSNVCVDTLRHRRSGTESLEPHEFMLADDSEDAHEASDRTWRHGVLLEAIAKLPCKYRRIVEMRHFHHMDVSEIAIELGKPEGTVKSWLFRARTLLRRELAPVLGAV